MEKAGLDAGFGKVFDKCLVLWKSLMATEELKESLLLFFFIVGLYQLLGFGKIIGGKLALNFIELFDERLIFFKHLDIALWYRTGYN